MNVMRNSMLAAALAAGGLLAACGGGKLTEAPAVAKAVAPAVAASPCAPGDLVLAKTLRAARPRAGRPCPAGGSATVGVANGKLSIQNEWRQQFPPV